MLTAAVRDLHCCYPGKFATDVRTLCPEFWENNPYLTKLAPDAPDVETLDCEYPLINRCNRIPYHCLHGFIDFLNQRLGLQIKPTAFKGDIHLSALEKSWYSQVREVTKKDIPFWIIAAGGKYDIPIKWWEHKRYQQVVDYFAGKIQFVQIGNGGHHHPKLRGVIDLRGQTNLRELVRLVHHAQGVLCSVTCVMHLAAAVGAKKGQLGNRPCVVVAGGREPAHWEAYPDHQFIHTNGALPCCQDGACWKDRTTMLGDGDKRDQPQHRCHNITNGLPQCMDMITAEEVIRRIELYFSGGRLKYLSPKLLQAAQHGITETVSNPFDNAPLNIHRARLACEHYIQSVPEYPKRYQGRGIIICGGGEKYFTCAWVCVNMLRRLGCKLPIQLWYLGAKEVDSNMADLVAPLGVTCVDAAVIRKTHPVRILGGWELKPYAVLHCHFKEVLLLDADNVPVVNPEYLFQTHEFKSTGAIFWPDYGRSPKGDAIWQSCGVQRPPGREFESGQMLLDKRRCWQALNLTLWFNEHSDFYYRYLHGDKETFHLAFMKLGKSFSLVRKKIHPLDGTMCQHDFKGKRVFQHRNTDKWKLHSGNKHVHGFWYETECREYLDQLRQRWDGQIASSAPIQGTDKKKKQNAFRL